MKSEKFAVRMSAAMNNNKSFNALKRAGTPEQNLLFVD